MGPAAVCGVAVVVVAVGVACVVKLIGAFDDGCVVVVVVPFKWAAAFDSTATSLRLSVGGCLGCSTFSPRDARLWYFCEEELAMVSAW